MRPFEIRDEDEDALALFDTEALLAALPAS